MMHLDSTFEIVSQRQEDLRSLASSQPLIPLPDDTAHVIRLRLGRTIVRFGTWLRDECPDLATEPTLTIQDS